MAFISSAASYRSSSAAAYFSGYVIYDFGDKYEDDISTHAGELVSITLNANCDPAGRDERIIIMNLIKLIIMIIMIIMIFISSGDGRWRKPKRWPKTADLLGKSSA